MHYVKTTPVNVNDDSIGNYTSEKKLSLKSTALNVSAVTFYISLVIFVLFDSSSNQFQFVQSYKDIVYLDLFMGVDGLSVYFVLLTTIIMPISLLSN